MAPHRVAVSSEDQVRTFADVERRSIRIAHALRTRGVGKGDRVAYLGLNSADFLEVLFATAKLGAVIVPLNTRLAPPEIAYILGDCEPKMFVWDEPFGDLVHSDDVLALGLDTVAVHTTRSVPRLEELVADADAAPIDEAVALDDLFMLQYTSGTSGHPKGVMLTHGNVTWNVYNLLIDLDLTSKTVALIVPPLFHTAALNMVFLPVFLKGGRCILHQSFDIDDVIGTIEQERVTFFFGVPAMYVALMQHPRWHDCDLSSVKELTSGAAPMPKNVLEELAARGIGIVQGYGLTEAAPGLTMLRDADALAKLGSVGTPCFFTDVRLVDDVGAVVPVNEPGEIVAQGPHVSPGYWRNPEATDAVFTEDGWLRTGDLGRTDEDGFLTIVDRVKDMIISGGENIYPAEVEHAINAHPSVAEVAVVGVPDPRWGEVGRAVLTLRSGASLTQDELLEFLKDRLAHYKIPKSVVFVEELPHTASGKILKRELRRTFGTVEAGADT